MPAAPAAPAAASSPRGYISRVPPTGPRGRGAASGAGGGFLAARIHESAATDRRKDQRHGQRLAKHGDAQIARRCLNGATRPECHVFKRPAVSTQRSFVLRATIDIVKYYLRKTAFRRASQIFNVNNARRGHGSSIVMLSRAKHLWLLVWRTG